MGEWIAFLTENAIVAINGLALIVIVIGTIEMALTCVRAIFAGSATGKELRNGYLRYARWLIAGLTFQLATDIIESARAPSWEDIGRLAAIAVIRTFLNSGTRHQRSANDSIRGGSADAARGGVASIWFDKVKREQSGQEASVASIFKLTMSGGGVYSYRFLDRHHIGAEQRRSQMRRPETPKMNDVDKP